MIEIASLAISVCGLIALSLSMARHQDGLLDRKLSPRAATGLRALGFALLMLSFAIALTGDAPGVATVTWFGLLTLAAMVVIALNTWRSPPKRIAPATKNPRVRIDPARTASHGKLTS